MEGSRVLQETTTQGQAPPPDENGVDEIAVLAVDIGATKIAVGIVVENGQVIARERTATPADAPAALAEIARLVDDMLRLARDLGVMLSAVGIACGGPLDIENGLVLSPPNLPTWDRVPIVELLSVQTGLSAHLQNDAAAGAMATDRWDNPHGDGHIVYITVSSGIGCGVINDGSLLSGAHGNGSELGHIPLIWNGRACRCGQLGCVEAYVSGTAIGERFTELERTARGAAQPETVEPKSAFDVATLVALGDEPAIAHWAESMAMLKRTIRAAITLFDPALVVIGGGVSESGPLLSPALTLDDDVFLASHAGSTPVIRVTGFGRDSGVLSAASVAFDPQAGTSARKAGRP